MTDFIRDFIFLAFFVFCFLASFIYAFNMSAFLLNNI